MKEAELATRLREYANEFRSDSEIAIDLRNAAEILDKIEQWRNATSGTWLKEHPGPWQS